VLVNGHNSYIFVWGDFEKLREKTKSKTSNDVDNRSYASDKRDYISVSDLKDFLSHAHNPPPLLRIHTHTHTQREKIINENKLV